MTKVRTPDVSARPIVQGRWDHRIYFILRALVSKPSQYIMGFRFDRSRGRRRDALREAHMTSHRSNHDRTMVAWSGVGRGLLVVFLWARGEPGAAGQFRRRVGSAREGPRGPESFRRPAARGRPNPGRMGNS